MDCPFCNKTKEEAFLSSDNFLAIYNLRPILPGHCLVISREHVESLFELSDDKLAEFMQLGRDAAKVIMKALDTDSFDWAIQEKKAAGQSVSHLHMHIIPRKFGDLPEPGDWYQKLEEDGNINVGQERIQLKNEELDAITKRLKKFSQKI